MNDLRQTCIKAFGAAVVGDSFMRTIKFGLQRQGVPEPAIQEVEIGYPTYGCAEEHVVVHTEKPEPRIMYITRDSNVFEAGQQQPTRPPPIQLGAW